MKKLILLLFPFLITSCLFGQTTDKEDSDPPREVRESQPDRQIEYDESEEDSSVPANPFKVDSKSYEDTSTSEDECRTTEVRYISEKVEVDSGFWSVLGFQKEIKGKMVIDHHHISPDTDVYLKDLKIVLDKGGDFDFIKYGRLWIEEAKVNENLIAWRDSVGERRQVIVMRTDSDMEISDYLSEGTDLHYTIGASQPGMDMTVHVEWTMIGAVNCD